MQKFKGAMVAFVRDEEAATAAEYGLMAALIAGVIITVVTALGGNIKAVFEKLGKSVGTAATSVN